MGKSGKPLLIALLSALIALSFGCSSSSPKETRAAENNTEYGSSETAEANTNQAPTTTTTTASTSTDSTTAVSTSTEPANTTAASTTSETATTAAAATTTGSATTTTGEDIFRRTNYGYHGGVLLKDENSLRKLVGFDMAENKLYVKKVTNSAVESGENLTLGENETYVKHPIKSDVLPNGPPGLPIPGIYITALDSDSASLSGEVLSGSMGILAINYEGNILVGVKLVGDKFVPTGRESLRVDTGDLMKATVRWSGKNFKNPVWKESEYQINPNRSSKTYFKLATIHKDTTYNYQFLNIMKMEELDAELDTRMPIVVEEDPATEGP